ARRFGVVEDLLPVRVADDDRDVPPGKRFQVAALTFENQFAVVDDLHRAVDGAVGGVVDPEAPGGIAARVVAAGTRGDGAAAALEGERLHHEVLPTPSSRKRDAGGAVRAGAAAEAGSELLV